MRKVSVLFIALTAFLGIFAQSGNNLDNIVLNVFIPEDSEIPQGSRSLLQKRLLQVASKNGVSGEFSNSPFVMTAVANITEKNVTSTAPPMTTLTMDLGIYIGNGVSGELYDNHTITVKGAGQNETKANNQAFKQINADDKAIGAFISKAKAKIFEYYKGQCDPIIAEAKNLQTQRQFEQALSLLSSIPSACADCYAKASTQIDLVYNDYLSIECERKLNEAKTAWAASPNSAGADKVASILVGIDPKAPCVDQVHAFIKDVAKRVLEVDQREWDFVLNEQQLEKDRIEAGRAVGVAYGKGQPQNVTYNFSRWW